MLEHLIKTWGIQSSPVTWTSTAGGQETDASRTHNNNNAPPQMLPVAMIIAMLVGLATAKPSLNLENHFSMENNSEEVRSAAIKRLLEVFGMEDPPLLKGDKQPPQYMINLYNTVRDVDDFTKDPYLLGGIQFAVSLTNVRF